MEQLIEDNSTPKIKEELTPEEIEKATVILEQIKKDDMNGITQDDVKLAFKYIAFLENENENKNDSKKIDTVVEDDEQSPASVITKVSDILSRNELTLLLEYINTNQGGTNNVTLGDCVYRGTRDGDTNFHDFADDKGPNVVLIRANNNTFGGFTSLSWSRNGSFKTDKDAFVFSLTDSVKIPVHQPTNYWAIYNVSGTYSFFFGYPSDIIIYSGFLTNEKNQSKVGQCYRLNEQDTNHRSLCGQEFFKVDELEVYQILDYSKTLL